MGQTRTVSGRVLTEDLEPLPSVTISNSAHEIFGQTDFDGKFVINISEETKSLLFQFIGMESAEILLKNDCNTVEIILMNYTIYDFMSSKKIDRLRKRRFDDLFNTHQMALRNGYFLTGSTCYNRVFNAHKPSLDSISKRIKEFNKTNTNNFKALNIGDTVKIPFHLNSSKQQIQGYYSACESCTENDFDFLITGKVTKKNRKHQTLEIIIIEMSRYDSLDYAGKSLKVGNLLKYEMKYFAVLKNYTN